MCIRDRQYLGKDKRTYNPLLLLLCRNYPVGFYLCWKDGKKEIAVVTTIRFRRCAVVSRSSSCYSWWRFLQRRTELSLMLPLPLPFTTTGTSSWSSGSFFSPSADNDYDVHLISLRPLLTDLVFTKRISKGKNKQAASLSPSRTVCRELPCSRFFPPTIDF